MSRRFEILVYINDDTHNTYYTPLHNERQIFVYTYMVKTSKRHKKVELLERQENTISIVCSLLDFTCDSLKSF